MIEKEKNSNNILNKLEDTMGFLRKNTEILNRDIMNAI